MQATATLVKQTPAPAQAAGTAQALSRPDNRLVAQRQLQLQQRIGSSPRQLAQLQAIAPVQRVKVGKTVYKAPGGKNTKELLEGIKKHKKAAKLARGWQKHFKEKILPGNTHKFADQDELIRALFAGGFKRKLKADKKVRPSFPGEASALGKITLGLQTNKDQSNFSPLANDAALPHRFSFADIMRSTEKFISGIETAADLKRWSNRLKTATEQRRDLNAAALAAKGQTTERDFVVLKADVQLATFELARTALIVAVAAKKALTLHSAETQNFLRVTNGLYGNIPDYGPHNTINNPVSNRLHLHLEAGQLTPGSIAAGSMTPTRISKGLAMTADGNHLVTTDGKAVAYSSLLAKDRAILDRHQKSPTSVTTATAVGHTF